MCLRFIFCTILLLVNAFVSAQELVIVKDYNEYKASFAANNKLELQEIAKQIPNIKLDIKYATTNNFSGFAVYKQAKAFARKPVVDALKQVQKELNSIDLGLKIFDAYRPYTVTVKFWKVTPQSKKEFVANPKTGSRHNRGCAVDLTLINLETGAELEMPTPYDSFAREASPTYENISPKQKLNRNLLINIMQKNGFKVIKNEWWHYDFIGWENYPIMDIPFEKL
ncbi:M15 family metallopeptidase [Pedobacter alpinus]|uniref:D-alanyl-D-alanine dipeptidase n=1 Tax=Pedobacter alpinus TaxID=1590643 RepID=A0ABW5TQ72_9SPHI